TATGVYGLSYRWGDSLANATLVPEEGAEESLQITEAGQTRQQIWKYPGRAECLFCHTPEAGYALAFNTAQLNRSTSSVNPTKQIWLLQHAGCFASEPESNLEHWPLLTTESATGFPLGYRARSYLAANCSQCHQPGAPGGDSWDARLSTPLSLA